MTGAAAGTWAEATPVLLVTVVVLLLPGAVALRLAGMSWWRAVPLGAPVTVSAVVLASAALPVIGWSWSVATLLATVALLWLLAGLIGLARRGRGGEPDPGLRNPWWAAAGIAVGVVLGAWPVFAVLKRPDAVPQAPDTIFHIGTIMTMVATGDASTLHATAYTAAPGDAGPYPAAFHVIAATVALLTGAQAVVAANAVALVASVVVWPLGLLACARELFGDRRIVLLTAPIAAVAFAPFPTWFLGYGVLWPNLLGQALIPAVLALFVGPVLRDRSVGGLLLLLATVPGLVASHPNAAFGLAVVGAPAVLAALVVAVREAETPWARGRVIAAGILFYAVGVTALVVLTRAAARMQGANPAGPKMSWEDAWVDVLFAGARTMDPAWLTGALVLFGAVVVLRRPRAWWLTVSWVLVAALYLYSAALDSPTTRLFTWPWYNNSPRLAALLVLPSVLLLVAALEVLADLVARLTRGRVSEPAAAVLVAGLAVVGTLGVNLAPRSEILDETFNPPESRSWVSETELAALRVLARELPEDAVVAANPWLGGQYLFPVGERRLLFPSEKVITSDPDLELLGRRLDAVGDDPQVCRAAQARGVEWALTGGQFPSGARRARVQYRGVDAVASSPAWEAVATEGPFTLHQRVACAEG